jgi:hypothetical protein
MFMACSSHNWFRWLSCVAFSLHMACMLPLLRIKGCKDMANCDDIKKEWNDEAFWTYWTAGLVMEQFKYIYICLYIWADLANIHIYIYIYMYIYNHIQSRHVNNCIYIIYIYIYKCHYMHLLSEFLSKYYCQPAAGSRVPPRESPSESNSRWAQEDASLSSRTEGQSCPKILLGMCKDSPWL